MLCIIKVDALKKHIKEKPVEDLQEVVAPRQEIIVKQDVLPTENYCLYEQTMESPSKYEILAELSKKISSWGENHPKCSPKEIEELKELRRQFEQIKKMNRVRSFTLKTK